MVGVYLTYVLRSGAFLAGALFFLKSRSRFIKRGCRRAAPALESSARNRFGTINGAQSAIKACSRAPKTNKRTARACITAAYPRKPSLARRLRAWTAPRTLSRTCCRSRLCLVSSFLHLCFFGVTVVFLLSMVLPPSLVLTFCF